MDKTPEVADVNEGTALAVKTAHSSQPPNNRPAKSFLSSKEKSDRQDKTQSTLVSPIATH